MTRDRVDEVERRHGGGHADRPDPHAERRRAPEGERAGDETGQQAAQRPEREEAAGVPLVALLVGEGDGGRPRRRRRGCRGRHTPRRAGARCATASAAGRPSDAACGWAGGSVRRWAAKARLPKVPAAAAVARPSTGSMVVARTVTRIGPTMKTISSTTASRANAVWRSGRPWSTWVQRARTRGADAGEGGAGQGGRDVGDPPIGQSASTETTSRATVAPNEHARPR